MASFTGHATVGLGVSIILWIAAASSANEGAPFAGGTGEPDDPYQIATAEQLLSIGRDKALQSRHFALVTDIDLDPNHFDNAPYYWPPLLTLSGGSIDGRGWRILNLRRPAMRSGDLGPGSVVRNLSLEGVVAGQDSPVLARRNEGFVVNCSVQGTSCGIGLVEENAGHVIGCSVAASPGGASGLVGTNSGIILHSRVTDGLATSGGLVRENSGTIFGCYATVPVFGEPTAGGLVCVNSGIISCCYATGNVSAVDSSAGGLAVYNSGTISDCYALGTVTGQYASGLARTNDGIITRCYAIGTGGDGLSACWPVSRDRGAVVNSYFLRAQDGGGINNGVGFPLSDAEMRRRESFVGWDFWGNDLDGTRQIWDMPPDGGYPILRIAQEIPFAGAGTADAPFLIESIDQFRVISGSPGTHYRLTTDVYLQGESFNQPVVPIFWGHLDGDGHALFNFTLTGEEDIAFFGILQSDATVANVNLQGVHVVTTGDRVTRVGILAVHNYGKVIGCSTHADTTALGYWNEYVAGLVVLNEISGEIARCQVRWIAADHSHADRGGRYWGGIAVHNMGNIVECHASGSVASASYCGILVGQNNGRIQDCYADGYCLGWRNGGIAGWNEGEVINCYAAALVPSSSASGGLVGEDLGGTIVNSYFLAQADGGGPDNGLGMPLSDLQMRRQTSFIGWDFENVWMICEGQDYPRLQWENVDCGEEPITGDQ